MENPPSKFFRLAPGNEVRLRYAYVIKCNKVSKNTEGEITEILCTYDPDTKSGSGIPLTRKVKGTIHWLSASQAIPAEIRLYDRLFINENPDDVEEDKDFKSNLNPDSLQIINGFVEPVLDDAIHESKYQFERNGYFCVDLDSTPEKLVFNRTVSLRDSWTKMNKD
jgi:glutaminyl-tRNA synthetase